MYLNKSCNYSLSVKSRISNGYNEGGFWFAKDEKSQLKFYNYIMSNYIYYMTKYDIPTLFLDFDRMVTDKKYLFENLRFILKVGTGY